MNLISKMIINRRINRENDNTLLENFDTNYFNKYKDDIEKIKYVLETLMSRNHHSYCSNGELISLLYVYTNSECIINNDIDIYTKNVIKSVILKELLLRTEYKIVNSEDLYSLLCNLKNEKIFYKYEFEKHFIELGDFSDLKKYYKNKMKNDKTLLYDILKDNPKQCYSLAKEYKSKEDEDILLPFSTLKKFVEVSNDKSLVINFANIPYENNSDLEDYVITNGDDDFIYMYLINVKNCNKKRLVNELKKRKDYYHLILVSCNYSNLTGIDFSKISIEDFFRVTYHFNIKNIYELLSDMNDIYFSNDFNYNDVDYNRLTQSMKKEYHKK